MLGKENLVYKLTKSLYGLKQAPRKWYLKIEYFMNRKGYKKCVMDQCCYTKDLCSFYIILLLYDDISVVGSNMDEINKLKAQLSQEFEMNDLGVA